MKPQTHGQKLAWFVPEWNLKVTGLHEVMPVEFAGVPWRVFTRPGIQIAVAPSLKDYAARNVPASDPNNRVRDALGIQPRWD